LAAAALGAGFAAVALARVAGTSSGHVGFWTMQPRGADHHLLLLGMWLPPSVLFFSTVLNMPAAEGPGAAAPHSVHHGL